MNKLGAVRDMKMLERLLIRNQASSTYVGLLLYLAAEAKLIQEGGYMSITQGAGRVLSAELRHATSEHHIK